jgi:hypothetical protein
MTLLRWGMIGAVLLAGPPLWSLVSRGELTADGALLRGGIVAGVCVVGMIGVQELIDHYQEEQDRLAGLLDDVVRPPRPSLADELLPAPLLPPEGEDGAHGGPAVPSEPSATANPQGSLPRSAVPEPPVGDPIDEI